MVDSVSWFCCTHGGSTYSYSIPSKLREVAVLIGRATMVAPRGWAKIKYTNDFKSGDNILGQSASKH